MNSNGHDRSDPDRFVELEISIAGKIVLADRSGAIFIVSERTLVVADLHFEKGSAAAERGSFIPPYDSRTTLGRLAEVIGRHDPDVVVALGDSFHDQRAEQRLADDDVDAIGELQRGRDWVWITGNHDPAAPRRLGGRTAEQIVAGGISLRHAAQPGNREREISGHLHPAARLVRQGYSLRRPCFFQSGRRLVLPAFGAYTGGLNVLDPAFASITGTNGFRAWLTGHEGVYPVATTLLRGD